MFDEQTHLTGFERHRLTGIRDWYGRQPGTADRLLAGASDRARAVVGHVLDSERGRRALERGTDRVLERLDERLLRDIDERSLLAGRDLGDTWHRSGALQDAEGRGRDLEMRYVGLLTGQAAVAGAASLTLPLAVLATAADVAGAVVGSLRAAGHTLAAYGLEVDHPGLLPASVALVAAAGETDPVVRRATIDDAVARLTRHRADVQPAERLPQVVVQQAGSRTVRETVEHVLRRVLQRRAVALVPVLGAVASGAASGWLASRVTEAARNAGTLVFLHRHAGVPDDILSAGRVGPTSAVGAV